MNRLLTLIQICLSLTPLNFGVSTSTNSSDDYSGEQPTTPTSPDYTVLPPFTTSLSCPCSSFLIISILGYSPCSSLKLLSPRECDAYVQVALRKALSSLSSKVDLPLFNNDCFFLFPFNEDQVSTFNQI